VLVVGAFLRLPPFAWALVVVAIALVLVAELFNSALEAVVDLASPDDHPLAKQAKDIAAGAVLVAAAAAVAIGLLLAGWALARAAGRAELML
jgi:diacylglycerol kinase